MALTVDGQLVEIRRSVRRRKTSQAVRSGDVLIITVPTGLTSIAEHEIATELVAKIRRREQHQQLRHSDVSLAQRAERLSRRYFSQYGKNRPHPTTVRWVTTMAKRWGSCTTTTGEIRLSHLIQNAPDYVIDAVLLHELTHLVEPNHGSQFYALVKQDPDYDRASAYLEGLSAGLQQRQD
ncbi:MAG: M48 metallopeptidase family protein [Propionibacteriaceae bacterium]